MSFSDRLQIKGELKVGVVKDWDEARHHHTFSPFFIRSERWRLKRRRWAQTARDLLPTPERHVPVSLFLVDREKV